MTRYTLHVPLTLNSGSDSPPAVLSLIEDDLLGIGGGFTATDATGAWRGDDGRIYREPVRLYIVDSADPDAHELLQALAQAVARWLDQEAVYLTLAPIGTELVTQQYA